MLPFSPAPLETLQRRYPHNRRIKIDLRGGKMPRPRPGDLYGCIFDCEDGMRLIISRDEYDDHIELHVASAPMKGTHLAERMITSSDEYCRLAMERFALISGDTEPLKFSGYSEQGIPHWRRPEESIN